MPKIKIADLEKYTGCSYPAPFSEICADAVWRKLGESVGLTDFGVNLVRLPPGSWSSQRHWHSAEDEFVWMLSGEVVLVEDDGDHLLRTGDCAGWKAGVANGHCLQNRSSLDAVYIEVGARRPESDDCDYPDIDMVTAKEGYCHRDGRPYPKRK